MDWHDGEVLNQYMEREKFPKVMIYSTHQETVAPLLGAFKNILLTDPAPASSVFFYFFAYKNEGDDELHQAVKVTYSESPWDTETHDELKFTAE